MREPTSHIVLGLTLVFCLFNVHLGFTGGNAFLLAGGVLGFCWVMLRTAYAVRRCRREEADGAAAPAANT